MVDCCPFRLVFGLPVHFKEPFYLIKHRLFCRIVRCAVVRRTLEHQVLKIVGETGRLGRVVLASDLHCDVCLYTRRLPVDAHVHLQPVVQSVDFRLQRVTCHSVVLVLRAGCHGNCCECRDKHKKSFHFIWFD